jgi:hypothetical protein
MRSNLEKRLAMVEQRFETVADRARRRLASGVSLQQLSDEELDALCQDRDPAERQLIERLSNEELDALIAADEDEHQRLWTRYADLYAS